MQQIVDMVELVSENIGAIADSEAVMGEPVQLGSVTIIPISRVSVGLGAGGGSGEGGPAHGRGSRNKDMAGKGTGGGTFGGGKVRPIAVVVVSESGLELLPVGDPQGRLEKWLDKVPDLIERFKSDDKG